VPRAAFMRALTVPVLRHWLEYGFTPVDMVLQKRVPGDDAAVTQFLDRAVDAAQQESELSRLVLWAMPHNHPMLVRRAGVRLGRVAMVSLVTEDNCFHLQLAVTRATAQPEVLRAVVDVAFDGDYEAAAAQLDATGHTHDAALLRRIAPTRRSLRLRARP
jgi:hypothetical protein